VAFTPGGLYPFFGENSSRLADTGTPLDYLWGASARLLGDELQELTGPEMLHRLERELVRRMDPRGPTDQMVGVERAIRSGISIGQVVSHAGTNRRRLSLEFRDTVGFGLKHYGRLCRFEHALLSIRRRQPTSLAAIAANLGYADQAHLTREFRHFAGITPGALHGPAGSSPLHLSPDEMFKTGAVVAATI
jgi:AraC-like DNA-binding protein